MSYTEKCEKLFQEHIELKSKLVEIEYLIKHRIHLKEGNFDWIKSEDAALLRKILKTIGGEK